MSIGTRKRLSKDRPLRRLTPIREENGINAPYSTELVFNYACLSKNGWVVFSLSWFLIFVRLRLPLRNLSGGGKQLCQRAFSLLNIAKRRVTNPKLVTPSPIELTATMMPVLWGLDVVKRAIIIQPRRIRKKPAVKILDLFRIMLSSCRQPRKKKDRTVAIRQVAERLIVISCSVGSAVPRQSISVP